MSSPAPAMTRVPGDGFVMLVARHSTPMLWAWVNGGSTNGPYSCGGATRVIVDGPKVLRSATFPVKLMLPRFTLT
jgi:hypothetical protein